MRQGLGMPSDPLLSSFVSENQGHLQLRLADLYDSLLSLSDEDAAKRLKQELDRILQERIGEARKG